MLIELFLFLELTAKLPAQCEYSLSYTTDYRWDFVSFLADAQLLVKRSDIEIATAKYHHYGGFDLSKFENAETKLTPVLDSLFMDFKRVAKSSDDKMLSNKPRQQNSLLHSGSGKSPSV